MLLECLTLLTKILKNVSKFDAKQFLAKTNESQSRMYFRKMQNSSIPRNVSKGLSEFSKHYEVRRFGTKLIRKKMEYSSAGLQIKRQGLALVKENIDFPLQSSLLRDISNKTYFSKVLKI